jgi:photosystem II stability/assembly factor-like uncharacterized protein
MKRVNRFLILTLTLSLLITSCENEDVPAVTKGILSYKVSSSNIGRSCLSIFFPSETIGYATTEGGSIYKTSDGGLSWNKLNISSPVPLRTSYFLNNVIGYAFGGKSGCSPSPCEPYGSIAYKTIDGGKTWQRLIIPYKWSELSSTHFVNETIGVAVGKGMSIKTSDGGKSWHQLAIDGTNLVSQISFTNQNIGYALNSGSLFKTNNGGGTWTDISVNDEKLTYSFCFLNDTLGYASSANNLYKTKDGGGSWTLVDGVENFIHYVHFLNEELGITLSQRSLNGGVFTIPQWTHIVRFTKDGGQTWTTFEYGQQEFNERCLYARHNIIYSLGSEKIFKLTIE